MNGTAFSQVITPPQEACGRHAVLAIVIMSGKGHELSKPFNWHTRDKKDLNKPFDKKATYTRSTGTRLSTPSSSILSAPP
jgi:hypothetical protein